MKIIKDFPRSVLDVSKLREEKRAGLLYAIDASGNTVGAENAQKGESYRCPICNCKMHVCRTPSGKFIFARNPGEQHTDGKCMFYEKKPVKHTFGTISPEKFIESLCRISPRKASGTRNVSSSSVSGYSDSEADFRVIAFSSLKQIAEELFFLDGGTTEGNHKISDFVVTFKTALQVFKGSSYDLGARIIFCRYMISFPERKTMLFDLFVPDSSKFCVRFCLQFRRKSEFSAILKKFGDYGELEDGSTGFIKKHRIQEVLMACDNWEFINSKSCYNICGRKNCKGCYGLYRAVFTNSKQLYLIPADH